MASILRDRGMRNLHRLGESEIGDYAKVGHGVVENDIPVEFKDHKLAGSAE